MHRLFQVWWLGVVLAVLPLCDTCWRPIQVAMTKGSCGVCGDNIQVSFTVRNKLQVPYFESRHTVSDLPQRELIHFLERAAESNSQFSFTVDYHQGMGYFITRMNGLAASAPKKTFWKMISSSSGEMLPLGVSQYIPKNKESITFDFTSWAAPAPTLANTSAH
ncbi:unnamed protein product [Lymnaea stagnalis]|uniref:Transcobalamin-like C-terminal domain-containing protein n=1 Tax=Lymnaea stagnalis TaxID=6523 RepID=A0AAV2IEN8_LYMST